MVNLNDDFSTFAKSPEAKKPAFNVKDDWRQQQLKAARENGDLESDANPDTSLTNTYADTSTEEDENYEYQDDGTARGSW